MRLRSRVLDVVVAVLAVAFTVWWFVPGEGPPAAEGAATLLQALQPQSLQGTVVDEAGAPVADVWLVRFDAGKATTLASTFGDGRFAVKSSWTPHASRTEVYAFHPQFDVAHEWLPWGRDDLRLVLRPLVPIEVRVVDENGERVRAVQATCHWDPVLAPEATTWLGANGDVLRGAAFRGTNYLTIELAAGAEDVREAIERRAITVVEPGPVQLTVVAATMLPREIHVVARDDAPVADAWVELIDGRGSAVTAYQQTIGSPDAPIQVGTAKTDALGTARPLGPVGRPLVVRATRRGFAPGLVADVRVPSTDALVVRLGRCASGRGRVLADAQLAARIAAGGCHLFFAYFEARDFWSVPLDVDGSFTFDGVQPRHWEGTLLEHRGRRERFEDCGVWLDLKEGDNPLLVIDMRDCARTQVSLRVRFNGKAVRHARVDFLSVTSHVFRADAQCDEEGRCSTRLRPDSYLVSAWSDTSTWSGDAEEAARAVLAVAGDHVDCDLDFGIGEMAVTFVDAQGGPLLGLRCTADWTLAPGRRAEWTNADGDGVLRKTCSAGDWAVFVGPHPRHLLGAVTVRAGEVTKATFVVPDDVPR